MFTKAIVRSPGCSMISGLTKAGLGTPDYTRALAQHRQYIAALESCGLEVLVLPADEDYPDSTFVEDVALLTAHCAIITRPAAPSRVGEISDMRRVLERYFTKIEEIAAPGTLDGGDVMQVGGHCYIGLSARTNSPGATQLIEILRRHGLSGSTVPVTQFLHLKTGVTCIADRTLLATGEFIARPEFSGFTILPVADQDAGGANCIRINDRILMPAGFPAVRRQLAESGARIVEIDISEYAKLDGGLTCMSLRF